MADVFEDRLKSSHQQLKQQFAQQCDVPEDRKFIGLDAYRRAIDCLKPGDVAILATPPAFRWPHFAYAIEKAVHVFMEKPVTVDGPTTKRMILLADEASKKNLKVGVGLMWRHCQARQELCKRVQDGEIGDVVMMRAYRLHAPIGFFAAPPKPEGISHLMYQIQRFHAFLWASGGCYSDFYIHNIDELCWIKGAWPIAAHGLGGRHFRGDSLDQNFDNYSVEYTLLTARSCSCSAAAWPDASRISPGICTVRRGWAQFPVTPPGGAPAGPTGARPGGREDSLESPPSKPLPAEWDELVGAIRADRPYNEAAWAEAALVT